MHFPPASASSALFSSLRWLGANKLSYMTETSKCANSGKNSTAGTTGKATQRILFCGFWTTKNGEAHFKNDRLERDRKKYEAKQVYEVRKEVCMPPRSSDILFKCAAQIKSIVYKSGWK